MNQQARSPGVWRDATEAEAGQAVGPSCGENSAAEAGLPAGAGPRPGRVTHDPLCMIRPRGADLVLTGEIDLHNAAEIEAHVHAQLRDVDNHLDLTAVDFIDSMGLTCSSASTNSPPSAAPTCA